MNKTQQPMKTKLIQKHVVVKKSSLHGYGVFATTDIRKGTIIEECYYILAKKGDHSLEDYYFDVKGKNAILLGFGCIYNHSDDPNADYNFKVRDRLAVITAQTAIKKGEEICISYGDTWFSSRNLKAKDR